MLPESFLCAPIAHRALHDIAKGHPENSRAAIKAAIALGFGIEIDIQRSADGEAMVFHDYDLGRLTDETGPVAGRTAAELSAIHLRHGDEGIPTLAEVLNLVNGQVPLLIEVKDQDGALGPNIGPLEARIGELLRGYSGPVAVMSFNPHSVAAMAEHAPDVPRGLTTCAFEGGDWPLIPEARRMELRRIPDFERVDACFISHDVNTLTAKPVMDLHAHGHPILCWTVRSSEIEQTARQVADNITFEGYLPTT